MKIKFNEKQTTRAVYCIIVFAVCLLMTALVFKYHVILDFMNKLFTILAPVIWGVVIVALIIGIFAGGMGFDIGFQGLIISVLTLASYFIGHYMESGVWEIANSLDGMTMAFLTLSMVEIFHSFNMRSRRGSIFKMHSSNKFLWLSFIVSLICTVGVINVPFLRVAFKFEHISFAEYMVAMVLAVSIVPIMEITKAVQRKLGK